MEEVMQDITGLETEVSEAVTVMQSAKALIDGFAARLADAAADPAKLDQLRSDLDTHGNALAAAVAANTVAEEEEPPAEPPTP
jgi:hypothetical protein